jgi:hypothetical protein
MVVCHTVPAAAPNASRPPISLRRSDVEIKYFIGVESGVPSSRYDFFLFRDQERR